MMAEMGHTTPALALAVYAQAMRRDDGEKARLRALVDGAGVAVQIGRREFDGPTTRPNVNGHGWARTSDLSRVKRALSH